MEYCDGVIHFLNECSVLGSVRLNQFGERRISDIRELNGSDWDEFYGYVYQAINERKVLIEMFDL